MKVPSNVIDFIEAEARGEEASPPGATHAQIPAQPARGILSKEACLDGETVHSSASHVTTGLELSPPDVADVVPVEQAARVNESIADAYQWLTEFVEAWRARG